MFADKFRNDIAVRLLEKFDNGGLGAVITVSSPNVDPLLPPSSNDTVSNISSFVKGVSQSILNNDPNLVATDIQVIVAAVHVTPIVGGRVIINGQTGTIVRVDAIPAAGDAAIYKFFVR